jgi:hypothetical protein
MDLTEVLKYMKAGPKRYSAPAQNIEQFEGAMPIDERGEEVWGMGGQKGESSLQDYQNAQQAAAQEQETMASEARRKRKILDFIKSLRDPENTASVWDRFHEATKLSFPEDQQMGDEQATWWLHNILKGGGLKDTLNVPAIMASKDFMQRQSKREVPMREVLGKLKEMWHNPERE